MFSEEVKGYSVITPEDAKAMMEKGGVVILDVREPGEFAEGYVEGAINVPLSLITEGRILPECPDLEKTILVYCRSGRRSAAAGRTLARAGYRDVRNFLGIMQWPYDLVK